MKNEELYLSIINNLTDGVYYVNKQRNIIFWNKAAEVITGYSAEEVIGQNCGENLLNHIDSEGRPLCVVGCPLLSTMIDGEQRKAEVFLRHKEGQRIPISVNIFPIHDAAQEIAGAAEVFSLSSTAVYEDNLVESLTNMAMYDTLTNLPNRIYLQSFLDYKMKEYKRFRTPFAVLFLDIDNFGAFNNEYGHDMGDMVLQKVAETIRNNTRQIDMFGRWGGEEFVGIYSIKSELDAPKIAEKVRMLVANTEIPYGETKLAVTVSIGATVYYGDDDEKSVIDRADQLMYKSKQAGKNRISCD